MKATSSAYLNRATYPVVITEPGKYQTKGGDVVTITEVPFTAYRPVCKGTYSNGVEDHWTPSGHIFPAMDSLNDLVKKID